MTTPILLSLLTGSLVFHQHPGCPENSRCSQLAGEKRNQWHSFLKALPENSLRVKKMENYRQNHGIPLDFWTQKVKKGDEIIRYDTSCKYRDKKIYLAQAIQKDFKKLLNDKKHILNTAFIATKNQIKRFLIPRSSIPLYTTSKGPVFSIEEEGYYYHLKTKKNGMIQVVHRKKFNRSQKQDCPEKLVHHFKNNHSGFYKSWFCRSVWNTDLSRYETMLFTWSCS